MDFHHSAATFPDTGDRLAHVGWAIFCLRASFTVLIAELPVRPVAQHAAGFKGAGYLPFRKTQRMRLCGLFVASGTHDHRV